jgi:hypothetical protein
VWLLTGYSSLSVVGITLISAALAQNCTLTSLNLCRNNIDPSCCYLLGEALLANDTLLTLDLSDNCKFILIKYCDTDT